MTTREQIHTILLGFHQGTETFQSANQKIEALILHDMSEEHVALVDDAHNRGYEQGYKQRDMEVKAALA